MDYTTLTGAPDEDFFDEEWGINQMIRQHKGLMKAYHRRDIPDYYARKRFSNLLKDTFSILKTTKKHNDRDAIEMMNAVETMVKEDKIKPTFKDWCLLFRIQSRPGEFYQTFFHVAGSRAIRIIYKWHKYHPRDINFIMAAIFTGNEEELFKGYEQLYYSVAGTRGIKNPYFRENSISLSGVHLPNHVVYAAICREVNGSIYTQTGRRARGYVNCDMLGFPRVWSHYNWDKFTVEYQMLFDRFRKENGRELEATDILVAALTQSNRFHGLKLIDPEECPVLKSWIEALPENHKAAIEAYKQAQWVKIDDAEETGEPDNPEDLEDTTAPEAAAADTSYTSDEQQPE